VLTDFAEPPGCGCPQQIAQELGPARIVELLEELASGGPVQFTQTWELRPTPKTEVRTDVRIRGSA
jgi:hypothetical protein